jgi:hypothetical protein
LIFDFFCRQKLLLGIARVCVKVLGAPEPNLSGFWKPDRSCPARGGIQKRDAHPPITRSRVCVKVLGTRNQTCQVFGNLTGLDPRAAESKNVMQPQAAPQKSPD